MNASTTLESSFSNMGGSIRSAELEAWIGPGYAGESLDFAGSIVWTCGDAAE